MQRPASFLLSVLLLHAALAGQVLAFPSAFSLERQCEALEADRLRQGQSSRLPSGGQGRPLPEQNTRLAPHLIWTTIPAFPPIPFATGPEPLLWTLCKARAWMRSELWPSP